MGRWRWFVVASAAVTIGVLPASAPAADQAVAERIDTGHTGFASGGRLGAPPLQQRWAIELGTGMTYPLIAGGRVFVTFRDPIRSSDMLAGLDATTGDVAWARPIGNGARLAYENGRVFALDAAGVATAVDAASGATLWVRFVFEPFDATGPVARNGLLYMFLAWSGGSLYALNQSDGTTRWRAGATYDGGTPAVDGRYVYVTDGYDCATSASDALTGVTAWVKGFDCWYPGGEWTATNGGHVVTSSKQILDAGSGLLWDEGFGGKAALAGALVLQLNGRVLQARDLRTGVLVWEFYGDGTLGSAPVVVNHTVYIGSTSGLLYAVDLATGEQRWSAAVPFTCEYSCGYEAVGSAGMAAGEGLLLVPAGGILYALESPTAPAAGLDLRITSGPDGPISVRSAGFSFNASGSGFAYRCALDGEDWQPCTSPVSYSGLSAGPHTFEVKTVSGAADIALASRGFSVTPDGTATLVTGGPGSPTNQTSASFTIETKDAVSTQCRIDGGSWSTCSRSVTYTGLGAGSHRFEARSTGANGQVEPTPAHWSWRIDLTAPDTTLTSAPSGETGPDVAVSFEGSEPGTFQCRLDTRPWKGCGSPHTLTGLAVGAHTLAVRAIDQAGNADATPASASWTVAPSAPPPADDDPGTAPPPQQLPTDPPLPTPTPTPGLGATTVSPDAASAPPLHRNPAALARALRAQLEAGASEVRARFKPRTAGRLTVEVLIGRRIRAARTRLTFRRPVGRTVRMRLTPAERAQLTRRAADARVRVTWLRGESERRVVKEARLG
jgi:outer membrane protein assembly factor BamB